MLYISKAECWLHLCEPSDWCAHNCVMSITRYRFVELYYRRGESTHKGKVVPARVETVVLFLPDIWSCVPTRLEWDQLHQSYRKHLERRLRASEDSDEVAANDEKAHSLLNQSIASLFSILSISI